MKKVALVLFSLVLENSAQAAAPLVYDKKFSVADTPPGLCRMMYEYNGEIFTCSAALIDSTHVQVAGHCIKNKFIDPKTVTLSCGVKGLKKNGKFHYTDEIRLKNFVVPTQALTHDFDKVRPFMSAVDFCATDVSILILKKPAKSQPMKKLPSVDAVKEKFFSKNASDEWELKPEIECRFSGFTAASAERLSPEVLEHLNTRVTPNEKISNHLVIHPSKNGDILLWKHRDLALDELKEAKDFAALKGTANAPFMFRKGDSGGPLYCSTDQKEWFLIGNASSISDPDAKLRGSQVAFFHLAESAHADRLIEVAGPLAAQTSTKESPKANTRKLKKLESADDDISAAVDASAPGAR